jgi:hypothetical protein
VRYLLSLLDSPQFIGPLLYHLAQPGDAIPGFLPGFLNLREYSVHLAVQTIDLAFERCPRIPRGTNDCAEPCLRPEMSGHPVDSCSFAGTGGRSPATSLPANCEPYPGLP